MICVSEFASFKIHSNITCIGDAAFAVERKAFQEEISTLQQQLSRVKGLELENNALRSRLEVKSAGATTKDKALEGETGILKAGGFYETHVPDAPSLVDYAKAVEANTTLKERLAKARNLNQQWAQFYRSTGRESADRKPFSLKDYCADCLSSKGREPEDRKSLVLKEVSQDCLLSKVEAPIDRALPSPKSPSYDSKRVSSSKAGPETPLQQEPAFDGLPPHTIAAENEGRPLQDPHENHTSSETDDPSEAGENSQNQLNLQSETPLKVDGDSESPVIVSERSLRRKRKQPRRPRNPDMSEDTQAQQGTIKKPFMVKSEPNSSSPSTHVIHSTSTNLQDSMDLDEVGERHFTPRKRRRLLDEELRRMSGLEIQTEAHNSEDFQDQTLVTETDEEAECEELADSKTQGRRHDIEMGDECRIPSRINLTKVPSQPILDKPRKVILAPSSILRSKDPNVQPLSSKRPFLKALNHALSQSQRSTTSNPPGFQEDFSQASDGHSLKEESTNAKSHKAHRAIDNHPLPGHTPSDHSPGKSLIDSVAKSKKATRDSKTLGKVMRTYSRSMTGKGHIPRSSIQKPTAVKSRRSFRVPTEEPDDPEKTLIEQEPLRSKPRKFLRPEDFKINPIHNHGYAHPVSEVVRNRDQRSCMPGCTRSNCCGSAIRKVVAMGGHFPAPKKSGFSKDVPLEYGSDDDARCLQAYLGDDYRPLKNLPWEDKEELLLAARTEQFANAYGKHRYQYGRQQTPPGFWDADMPSTQQEIKNKIVAKAMQKAKVVEMRREAMKPDGRYKFRDE